jgi:AcrR family transcriptional regulator
MVPAVKTVRAPGRPKSQTKRREIMRAAVELFMAKGYDGACVDEIALVAGVSKQTVYSHFENKEALFVLTVASKCRETGINPDVIDPESPPGTMLVEIGRRFIGMVTSSEAVRLNCVCIGSAETHPELGRLIFEHGPLQTVAMISDYLAAQHERKRLRVENPIHAAWQLVCMLRAEAQMRAQFNLRRQLKEDAEAYVKSCVEMFLRAYSPEARA